MTLHQPDFTSRSASPENSEGSALREVLYGFMLPEEPVGEGVGVGKNGKGGEGVAVGVWVGVGVTVKVGVAVGVLVGVGVGVGTCKLSRILISA